MIELTELSKVYRGSAAEIPILERASASFANGKLVAIIGASGSGKSTLLNLIAGLDRPDGGRISVNGTELSGLSDEALAAYRLRSIGIVFQFFNLLPTLTIRENVALPNYLQRKGRAEALRTADKNLEKVAIAHLAARKPHEVSGGELQRAAIARALMNEPDIILADEPTGNLDPRTGAEVLRVFAELGTIKPLTRILVTHSREVAAAADQVFELKNRMLVPVRLDAAVPAVQSQ